MTMTMTMDNRVLTMEELDNVTGGVAPAVVVAGISLLATMAYNDYKDLKNFVKSDSYKKMDASAKNKALGKELANSPGFIAASIPNQGLFVYIQTRCRFLGTPDCVRKAIENYFG